MEGVKKKADGTISLTAHMKSVDGLNQTIKRREKEVIRLEARVEELERSYWCGLCVNRTYGCSENWCDGKMFNGGSLGEENGEMYKVGTEE